MKFVYRIAADALFIIHFFVVFLALFGWTQPRWWSVYMAVLLLVLVSDLVFGYCVLSRWEFGLRKKVNPEIDYDYPWASFYTFKFTNGLVSNRFYLRISSIFLASSFAINLYFKYWY